MNEPLINPWIFYWIDVVDNLVPYLDKCAFVSLMGALWYAVSAFDYWITLKDGLQHLLKKCLFCGIFLIISLLLGVFIPSKETMYKMLIASQVTPHNLQVTQEVANDLLDNIEERAIKLIQEVKK